MSKRDTGSKLKRQYDVYIYTTKNTLFSFITPSFTSQPKFSWKSQKIANKSISEVPQRDEFFKQAHD